MEGVPVKQSISAKLTRESIEFVAGEAKRLGISRTAIIEMALRAYAQGIGKLKR